MPLVNILQSTLAVKKSHLFSICILFTAAVYGNSLDCRKLFRQSDYDWNHHTTSVDLALDLMSNFLIKADFTTTPSNIFALFPETVKKNLSNQFIATTIFPAGGNNGLRISEFKNTPKTEESALYARFPYLRSSPLVIPGSKLVEQRIYLAKQLLFQALYFHFKTTQTNKLFRFDETQTKILKDIFDNRDEFIDMKFLNSEQFKIISKQFDQLENRNMIAVKTDKRKTLYIDIDALSKDNTNLIQQLPFLIGLLGHELAHFYGYKDTQNRTLDLLAVEIMSQFQPHIESKNMTLPNGRVIQLYLFRTSFNDFKENSSYTVAGSRLILDDGLHIHDLTTTLQLMIMEPWAKDTRIAIPNYWGLKNLNPELYFKETSSGYEIHLTAETQINLNPNASISMDRNSFALKDTPNSSQKTESRIFPVRLIILFDKDKESILPKSLRAIDGELRVINKNNPKDNDPLSVGKDFKLIDLGLEMIPESTQLITRINAGSTFKLDYTVKIPITQKELIQQFQSFQFRMAPVLTHQKGEIGKFTELRGYLPQHMEIVGYIPPINNKGYVEYKIVYKFTIPETAISDVFFSDKAVLIEENKTTGYIMLKHSSQPLKIVGKMDHLNPRVELVEFQNNKALLNIESPFKIKSTVLEGEILYENSFGHKWSRPFMVMLYDNGKVDNQMNELIITTRYNSGKNIQLLIEKNPNYSVDVKNVKSYRFYNIINLPENRNKHYTPINFIIH